MIPVAVAALTLSLIPASGDWPQFLGPDRSGVSTESGWSPEGAPEPLWARNVGVGYSCVAIVGERLLTMGYDEDAQEDHVLCLDAATGEERWRHAWGSSDDPKYHGGGTLTTPAVVDGVVYVVNRLGRAFALALETGEVLWERDYLAELALEPTFHGFCASPIVVGERIVYGMGGTLAVVERDGGELLWRTEDHGDGAYTNPTVFRLDGRELVAVMLAQTLFVFDVESGERVHEMEWPLQGNAVHVAFPLVIGDRMLISTAYGKGASLLRLGDELEPEVVWTSRRLRNKVTGLFAYEDHVYGFDESMLKCFDLEGNEKWRERGLGMGALSIAGGRLLILSSNGELVVAEATPEEYRELSRQEVLDGGSYWTMPVLVDGRIYVRNSLGELACLDHRGATPATPSASAGGLEVPAAAELYAANDSRVGAQRLRSARGLQMTLEWEILGTGMFRLPAALTLVAPNHWSLALDSGNYLHGFDGRYAWTSKNGRLRLLDEDEDEAQAAEAPRLFRLAELFTPTPPSGAAVGPQPVAFAGASCWRVSAKEPGGPVHYFDVDSGRLVGREVEGISTVVFQGELAVDGALLPERIVLYRPDSGQEETLYLSAGAWLEGEAAVVPHPDGLERLLRTPEQRAADTERLRVQFAREVGKYRSTEENESGLEVAVDDGDFVIYGRGDRNVLEPHPEEEGAYLLLGVGATLRFQYDDADAVESLSFAWGPMERTYVPEGR